MRVVISAQALFDEGEVAWGYHHEETVVPRTADVKPAEILEGLRKGKPPAAETQEELDRANRETAAATLELLIAELERAKESILQQAAQEMMGDANASGDSR